MIVLMFKPRFGLLVSTGTKLQTVRPTRKREIETGTRVSLRQWSGAPYRSKQIILAESIVSGVEPICIYRDGLVVDDEPFDKGDEEIFARLDGFNSFAEMRDWFLETHSLPFTGSVIHWSPSALTYPAGERVALSHEAAETAE